MESNSNLAVQNQHVMQAFFIQLFTMFLLVQAANAQSLSILDLGAFVGGSETTVINEADVDSPGFDDREFVELFGEPGADLSDLVVVLYRGNNNTVYGAYDLDGFSLNEEGLFVLGSAAVANVSLVIPDNTLRNGPDAIALYQGSANDFPEGTEVQLDNLLDALVYDTNDADATGLWPLLLPDQPQINEAQNNNSALESMSRVPDGGAPRVTETYVAQAPTPGQFNVPACDGGTLAFSEGDPNFIEACSDISEPLNITVENAIETDYAFVLSTELNQIVEVFFTDTPDMLGQQNGNYRLWGVAYTGNLDPASLVSGLPITGIVSDDCAVLSGNFLEIALLTCIPPDCLGGAILVNGSAETQTVCWNGEDALLNFESNSLYTPNYLWVVTNPFGAILFTTSETSFDLSTYGSGNLLVRGVAYTGELDQSSIQAGQPFNGIASDDCFSVSENAVSVNSVYCAFTGGCGDLFISEYIEGNINNKALEIYNPTPFDIDLGPYVLQTYNNGDVMPTNTLNLSGILPSEATYVVVNSGAVPALLALGDITSNVTFYNGNDPIVLRKDGQIIDMMGIIGPDADPIEPNAWEVDNGNGSMQEHTLVRKANVTQGSTNWETGQNEWDVYPQDTFTFLGSHEIGFCDLPEAPTVSFLNSTLTVVQGQTAQIGVASDFPLNPTTVSIAYLGGTAVADVHFEDVFPAEITLEAEVFDPTFLSLSTLTDSPLDQPVTIELELQAEDGVNVAINLLVITIVPTQEPIPGPWYDIIEVRGVNDDFVADSLGVYCELRGVVHGLNTNPFGLSFTLIDETAGIRVYHPDNTFGYTVEEGDSLHVVGVIGQENGLIRIVPFGLSEEGQNLELNLPEVVVAFGEATESELIVVRCVEVLDPDQWTNEGPWFEVEVSGGGNTFMARIEEANSLFGTPAPVGVFNLIGIGSQDDPEAPYDANYFIVPRYLEDLSNPITAAFSFEVNDDTNEFTFTNESIGANGFFWSFGDGSTSTEENPVHTYTEAGNYEVSLSVSNSNSPCVDEFTISVEVAVGVEEIGVTTRVFPNPVRDVLTIQSSRGMHTIHLFDLRGQLLMTTSGNGREQVELDLGGLSQGTYILLVDERRERVLVVR